MPPEPNRRRELAELIGVIAVAAVVRAWRLGHGLPELPHVDAFKVVDEAARMLATGDWRPALFQHPQLYPRLLAVLAAATGADGEVARHLVGRVVSAVAGCAMVPAAFLLTRRFAGRTAALVAALVVALDPGAVTLSRRVAPDALMVAFSIWALVLLVDRRRRPGAAAGAGMLLGLGVATKLSALVLLPWLVAAPAVMDGSLRRWREWGARAAVSVVAAAVAVVAASPHLLLAPGRYLDWLRLEAALQHSGQIGRVHGGWWDLLLSATPTWEQPWLGTSLPGNLGVVVTAFAVGGLVVLLAGRGGRAGFVTAAFAIGFVAILVGPGRIKAYRFVLPALPALAAAAGWAVERVAEKAGEWRRPVAAVLAAAALAVPGWRVARMTAALGEPTTVALAGAWFEREVEPGTTVFLSPFFVNRLARPDLEVVALAGVGDRQYGLPEGAGPSPERTPIYDARLLDELRARGVTLLVQSSWFDDAFAPVPENLRWFPRSVAAYGAFRRRLEAEAGLVWSVDGWSAGRIGPDIEVWSLRAPSDPDPDPVPDDM